MNVIMIQDEELKKIDYPEEERKEEDELRDA